MVRACLKHPLNHVERPAKLRWYTNPPALLITYGSVSGNKKLVDMIRRAQSPKIAMDCGRDLERCAGLSDCRFTIRPKFFASTSLVVLAPSGDRTSWL